MPSSFRIAVLAVFLSASTASAQPVKVAAWGNNGYGEAWVPPNLANVKSAIIEGNSGLALLQNGSLVAWGDNTYGQTNIPANASNIIAIAKGPSHSVALRTNRTAVAWAAPGAVDSMTTNLAGFNNITSIAAGYNFTLLVQNGQVRQLPASTFSAHGLIIAPFLSEVKQISAGEDVAVALRSNGTVVVWGNPACTSVPQGLSDVKSVSAGYEHITALRSNGTVVAWGENYWHQTNVPSGLSNVVEVAAGAYHNLALRSDGSLVTWGDGVSGEKIVPEGLTNIVGIVARGVNSIALVEDGPICITKQPKGQTVFPGSSIKLGCTATGTSPLTYQWLHEGTNLVAETNSILSLANISIAQTGVYRVLVSDSATNVWSEEAQINLGNIACWGRNWGEQTEPPPGLTNVSKLSAGSSFSFGLRSDGTIATWGQNPFGSRPGVSNVAAIAAGAIHAMFLHTNGTVSAWGENLFGETQPPPNLTNAIAISAGSSLSVALKADKTVIAWGNNSSGQTNVPLGLSNVTAIVCGLSHSLALKSDGKVVAWGNNAFGVATVPTNLNNVVAIAGEIFSSLALKIDGTLQAWGSGITIPVGLSNVVAISGSPVSRNALALRSDGTVVAFGADNSGGQNNVPTSVTNVSCVASGSSFNMALVGDGSPVFPTALIERSVQAGDTLQLPALAAGAQPMSYQWQFNGQDILGQTSSILSIPNAGLNIGGKYRVIASNASGVKTNSATLVSVVRMPIRFANTPATLYSSNGMMNLRATGLAGSGSIVLFASTNLTAWQPIATNVPAIGETDFSVPAEAPFRFFRVVEEE